jgi:myo-inositol catabolism protein IolH
MLFSLIIDKNLQVPNNRMIYTINKLYDENVKIVWRLSMKIAFDVDVLAKQMRVRDYVYKVADWGYKYIEQSPQVQINPFYKHPLFSEDLEQEYRQALKDTGVEISSFICVYRWSGPTEVQRQHAVANWKALIKIAVNMGVQVINTELSGDPHQPEICNGMFFRSMEELLPIFEREGIRCEIQSHPYDFCELNDETVDMVNHFRSDNVKYVYSSPHAFYYDKGKGDFAHQLRYAGKALSHVLFADTMNHTIDCRYIVNPPGTDAVIHQHTAMGEGEIDFDVIFETLRELDFANQEFKVGGPPIACCSYFGYPEKMDKQAVEARERIERELLG